MCYAIPGRIESINGNIATVEYFGERKKVITEIDGLTPGDYIYAQGGYAINRITPREAFSILAVWKETFFELQELDVRLSRMNSDKKSIRRKTVRILDKAIEDRALDESELLYLLGISDKNELDLLYKTANFMRSKHLGNSCCVHGILEFSNYCARNCMYCGISSHNEKAERYRMTEDEIIHAASRAIHEYNFKTIVLQSGEDAYYSIDTMCDIIRAIKKIDNILIFVSIGERGLDGLDRMYQAGARGLLMRFETSNGKLYETLHPGYSLQSRVAYLEKAVELGYLVITGGLVGLPGQTDMDILNDILLSKKIGAEMYSFGPFIPHCDTPLRNGRLVDADTMLKVLSVCRIHDARDAKILITTAFETISGSAKRDGLSAGANSVMINTTPVEYREKYIIYPDRAYAHDTVQNQIEETLYSLRDLGRAPTDLGTSVKRTS